ncbi:MAG: lipid IV(A) 3-deoxy-D-manno-octulosonic acid transferase [Gammaproteobacteria bacterium]|jgi:3-deoxy-D-manno-octulosonic-acid transferase|nr:lipid IV(A) 3-deoxy-D-manno-octulosonic acid transferase [Gammaproteobacteria bacterium]
MNRLLYTVVLYLVLPLVLVRLAWRGLRDSAYWRRWPERFGRYPQRTAPANAGETIWVHAVSVGEVRAATPLVEALLEAGYPVYLTTVTPTGSSQVQTLFGTRVSHSYLPYDIPPAIHRFLNAVRPRLAVIMETEIWPNLFFACRERGVALLVANVRISDRSYVAYRRLRRFIAQTLAQVDLFAAQSQRDADRVMDLGAPRDRVHVTGNIKFELDFPASLRESALGLRRDWGTHRPVWIAASIHEGEEAAILDCLARVRHVHPGALGVLVPRRPERFSALAQACRRAGETVVMRSAGGGPLDPQVSVYIGDTIGELPLQYAAADVAFVGGSLTPVGGHNVLEACALGRPVLFGPHMENFREIAELVLEAGAGVQLRDAGELLAGLLDFLGDAERRDRVGRAGEALIEAHRGALAQTRGAIERLLVRTPQT